MPQIKSKTPQHNNKSRHNDSVKVGRSIDLLFGSGVRVDVLWCLMQHPDIGLDIGEMMRLTGRTYKDIHRALEVFQELEIVAVLDEAGLKPRFLLNNASPLIPPLRKILAIVFGGIDLIRKVVIKTERIDVAFIFGSFATSEQKPHSDIDLMVIGDHDQLKLNDEMSDLEIRIGREINVVSYTRDEWREAFQKKNHFVVSLMEAPKIYLRGDAEELHYIISGKSDEIQKHIER